MAHLSVLLTLRRHGKSEWHISFGPRKNWKPQFPQKGIVFRCCFPNFVLNRDQFLLRCIQVDFSLSHRGANVSGDVEVEALLSDALYAHALGVAVLFLAELVRLNDLLNVIRLAI